MTSVQEPQTVLEPITDADGFNDDQDHIYCCRDQDLALCGVDVTGEEFGDRGEEFECERCAEVDAQMLDWGLCPTGCPALRAKQLVDSVARGGS